MSDIDEIRDALTQTRHNLVDGAAELASAVKRTTDDPLLWQLADQIQVALRLEKRIRRLLVAEVAG